MGYIKIKELREKYDKSDFDDFNTLRIITPRSGKLLVNATETRESAKRRSGSDSGRYRLKSYTVEKLVWELPLDKTIRFDLGSGRNEGQEYTLKNANVKLDVEEI